LVLGGKVPAGRGEIEMANTHRCIGDPMDCEYAAVCEECGRSATPENPVLVTYDPADPDAQGLEFVCEYCKSYAGDSDELEAEMAKKPLPHGPARWVENPETGEGSYAATTEDGYPVLASGAIEGCSCGDCEGREDLAE
jgi:hypothetical protein